MGIDRPSRSSEDGDQPRRTEHKPSEQDSGKQARPSRPERPQPHAECKRESDESAAEAYRARRNSTTAAERQQEARAKHEKAMAEEAKREGRPERPQSEAERTREANKHAAESIRARRANMTGTERRQAIRDKHAQYLEQEKEKQGSTGTERDAKAYLEQRQARVEAYERGDLPRNQLSRSERNYATKRKFDRFVEAEKAKEGGEATSAERRDTGARPERRGYVTEGKARKAEQEATRKAEWQAARAEGRIPSARPDTVGELKAARAERQAAERADCDQGGLQADATTQPSDRPDPSKEGTDRGTDQLDTSAERQLTERADKTDVEAAKNEIRAALDSGDDAQLVEAARRIVDSADSGETGADGVRIGERSADKPADTVSAEPADNDGQTDDPYRKSLELTAAERAAELQGLLPEASRGRITMAVGMGHDADEALRTVIGTSEPNGYLRPSVRAKLQEGEEVAGGTSHAERNITAYMRSNEIKPLTIGAGRPICPPCSDAIDTAGASPATPLKER